MNTTEHRTNGSSGAASGSGASSPTPLSRRGLTGRRLRGRPLLIAAAFVLGLTACDDDPAEPAARGELRVDGSAVTFAETDPVLGSVEMPELVVSNTGQGSLMVSEVALEGTGADAFTVEGAEDVPFTLAPGASRTLMLGFEPAAEGSFTASLRIDSDDPTEATAEVALSGNAAVFTYVQVDRMGIPGLNTVFNHPSGTAGFDKTAYNTASPSDDVATYRDTFIVVLGAVGNADPEGTADLLLPDELPVDMGAAATAFADLTGRAPADDATDVALTVTVGVPGLQSDNVDSNDKVFPGQFPFFATPH